MIRLRRIFLLGTLAATVGAHAAVSETQQMTGTEGAVVLKLITNGRNEKDPTEDLYYVTIRREVAPGEKFTAMDEVRLRRTDAATHTTSVFSALVQPGRYTIVDASTSTQDYRFPFKQMLSPFEVKTHEVTLLGTLLVQPLLVQPLDALRLTVKFTVGYLAPETELQETFFDLFPGLAAQTRGAEVHTLEATPELERRKNLAPLFKNMSTFMIGLVQSPQGDFFSGGKLGKARWRKSGEARWREMDVGTWREVMSLRPYRGGLLAVGEEGLIRFSSDDGLTWRSLPAPDQGAIFAAEPLTNGRVFALSRYRSRWTGYVTDDLISGSWKKLGDFEDDTSLKAKRVRRRLVTSVGNNVGVMMSNGTFVVIDSDSGAITRFPTGYSAQKLSATPDGTLLMYFNGALSSGYVTSQDGGKAWTDVNVTRFTPALTFKDKDIAYAVTSLSSGLLPGEYVLAKSTDGGKTWAKTGVPPSRDFSEIQSLNVDHHDGSLVTFMRDGTSMRSRDQGETWTPER